MAVIIKKKTKVKSKKTVTRKKPIRKTVKKTVKKPIKKTVKKIVKKRKIRGGDDMGNYDRLDNIPQGPPPAPAFLPQPQVKKQWATVEGYVAPTPSTPKPSTPKVSYISNFNKLLKMGDYSPAKLEEKKVKSTLENAFLAENARKDYVKAIEAERYANNKKAAAVLLALGLGGASATALYKALIK